MKSRIATKITACCALMLLFILQATAQNKDIDKGKTTLMAAFKQKDSGKKQEMITSAKELFTKGGMKPQEVAVLLGDAYLDAGDLVNAQNTYGQANKEDKKEGLKKVADAYVEQAFSGEEKNESKLVNKAMSLYEKAGAVKEGARNIGDKYNAKGPAGLDKALEYYLKGDAGAKVDEIAKGNFDKGGENEDKAAEIYLKLKSPEGYQKAGDIYYNRKEYQKAAEAYIAGNDAEGLKKYANYLYAQNRNDEADNMYVKLAEIYSAKKNDEALEKLATESTGKGSYALAARIYDKSGNNTLADKSRGYATLILFELDSAKMYFDMVEEATMSKAIVANMKLLTPLKDISENFDELMRNAPTVNLITDSVTGQSVPSPQDQKLLEDYYVSIRDAVIKNVYALSAAYAKLTDPELRKFARYRFLHFAAVRNILDNETFAIKKQKQEIKAKDVVL